jgi:hypothetical protein
LRSRTPAKPRGSGDDDDVAAAVGRVGAPFDVERSLLDGDGGLAAAFFAAQFCSHVAVARAVVPRLSGRGTFTVVVGESASYPVPGSGLVSMEQAAVFMMRKVLAAEAGDRLRVNAFVLGPVRTRVMPGEPGWLSADQVGAVAVALSGSPGESREVLLRTSAEADQVLSR